MNIHDAIFAVGAAVLFFAMLPAVVKRSVLPMSTCLITGGVLATFVANYASIHYWYASVVEFGNVACWAWLGGLAVYARMSTIKPKENHVSTEHRFEAY